MLALSLALGVTAGAPGVAAGDSSPPTKVEREQERFETALLAVRGVDTAALVAAFGIRLPDLQLVTQWRATDIERRPGTLFVDIHRAPPIDAIESTRVQVDVVLFDGRAFRRELVAGPDDVRIIASFVSNLLLSIEERTVIADKEGVPIPESSEAVDIAAVVEKLDAHAAESTVAPPRAGTQAKEHSEPVARAEPEWLAWQLGPRASGQLALAFGPPAFADTLSGAGGSLGLDARRDTGLLLDVDLRVSGESKAQASLLRVRAAFGVGYELRRGRFALPASVAYTVEGYRLAFVDQSVSPLDLEAPTLLNGLRLRVSPALRLDLERGRLRALRFGLRTELAGSFGLDDGPRVLGIRLGESATGGDELFRLGGLEMSVGIELGADFGLPRTRASTPSG